MSKRKGTNDVYLWVMVGILMILMSVDKIINVAVAFVRNYGIIIVLCVVFIYVFYNFIKEKKEFVKQTLSEIDQMSGIEFEEYLYEYFYNEGYKVEMTSKSYDYGADLIISNNNKRTVIQAKRYTKKVGVSAIQEVNSAKSFYRADSAIVITNNFYTNSAIKLAASNSIELWDRNTLERKTMVHLLFENDRSNIQEDD